MGRFARIGIDWIRLLLVNPMLIRFFIPWITSLKDERTPLKDGKPWITFEAEEWLNSFLDKKMSVFEWGSGGSTIFLSRRVKKLVSVEHDPDWYKQVKIVLKKNNISNCKCLLIEPERTVDMKTNPSNPLSYASSLQTYEGMSFETYAKSIEPFPDESFDLVLIDGRARPSCVFHAISKVRLGGFLMLDDSDRKSYQIGENLLVNWKRADFFGPCPYSINFRQTTVWKKAKLAEEESLIGEKYCFSDHYAMQYHGFLEWRKLGFR